MMKKEFGLLFVFSFALADFAAPPTVSKVSFTQDAWTRRVKISYGLDIPAVVTVDIRTNGVSIGAGCYRNMTGAVNRLVDPEVDTCEISWQPLDSWPGWKFTHGEAEAVVTAWATNATPDYLVVDLEHPGVLRYYVSPEAFPEGGVTNDVYRTSKLVMRRIHAANERFRMGEPLDAVGRGYNKFGKHETVHYVTLTNDFYIGVFTLTEHQFVYLENGSSFPAAVGLPKSTVSHDDLRGSGLWPSFDRSVVGNGSKFKSWRERYGIDFDLPTEAEWEFACRAGTLTSVSGGFDLAASTGHSEEMDEIAWYADETSRKCVGLKKPNPWGLYDMHGNIWEACLDYFADEAADEDVVAPRGPLTGTDRVARGGSYYLAQANCRSVSVAGRATTKAYNGTDGFRLWCRAGLK